MKKRSHRFGRIVAAVVLSAVIALPSSMPAFAADAPKKAKSAACEYEYMEDIKVSVKSPTKTVISWKKRNVDKYVIYKANDEMTKWKKVATIPGNRTSYTVKTKKNNNYNFEVRGRKYKKGTKKKTHEYYAQAWFYSGVSPVSFDEYLWAEGKISTKKIELRFGSSSEGLKPDGYQILRKKEGAKKFKVVKTIKGKAAKKDLFVWTDKDVKARKSYTYKVRGYKKIGKKTWYGPSDKMTKRAVRMNGAYTVTGNPDADEPVLKITGNKNNGELSLHPAALFNYGYGSQSDESVGYVIRAISLDGTTWFTSDMEDAIEALSVDGSTSFWLKFEKADRPQDDPEEYPAGNLCTNGLRYEGIPVYLDLYPYDGSARTFRDSEAIH